MGMVEGNIASWSPHGSSSPVGGSCNDMLCELN